jgi:PAS domain S-box-containing protein
VSASGKRAIEPSSDGFEIEPLEQLKLKNYDILESVTDAFAAFDSEWRFIYVNAAAERFLGAQRQDIVGRNHWELFPKTVGTVVEENYRSAVAEGVTVEFEFFYEHWNRWFSIRCYPVANGGLTNYFQDVTKAKLAEQELKHRIDALQRANRLLEEFAYISSHDLQEPIRNIMISAELLNEELEATSTEAKHFVDGIHKSAKTLDRLVRDLLEYSRVISADDGVVGAADLTECLREAMTVMQQRIDETGATVTWDPLPCVRGDRLQLTHVFQNLLSNSLKYRRQDVPLSIHVASEREEGGWKISFRDNGIGFDARHADRIFGLFKRLHREDVYAGTGLGLAICRRIVERYRGSICAEGKPGEGAVFHMRFKEAEIVRTG